MSEKNFYIIDTSSLIELNKKYPVDVFPSLWKKVEVLISKGILISHREVFKEIIKQDDILKKWASTQKNFFKGITKKQMEIVKEILKKYPTLIRPNNESGGADPFLIALAIETGISNQKELFPTIKRKLIVTEEKMRGNRIRIPYVCKDYNIDCIDIIEMYREEGWSF